MTPAVEISNVTMTYGGKVTALEDIGFAVQPGEFVSILGPSGCGKSTLLMIVADKRTHERALYDYSPADRTGRFIIKAL